MSAAKPRRERGGGARGGEAPAKGLFSAPRRSRRPAPRVQDLDKRVAVRGRAPVIDARAVRPPAGLVRAESRVRYDEQKDQVIYSSGKRPHPGFKANFRVFEAQDFIAALCAILPDPKRHESISYGEYSNVVRGERSKAGTAPPLEEQDPLRVRLKKAWQEVLKRIYEVDPLRCPCGGAFKRISVITDPEVIKKILLHLGRWPPPHRPPKRPRPPPPRREEAPALPDPPLSEAEASQLPLWWDQDEAFTQLPFPEEG